MKGGGAEKQLCHLVKAQIKKGIDVHVLILEKGVNYDYLVCTGATVHWINVSSFYSFQIFKEIRKLIDLIQPDIIQCWQRPMDFFASIAALVSGVPFVLAERSNPAKYTYTVKGMIKLIVMQFSAGVIANSEVGYKYWKKKLLLKKEVSYIPNIVPIEYIQSIQPLIQNRPYLICIGRLSIEKNQLILIKAFAASGIETHKLIIVGEGPLFAELNSFIQENDLSNRIELLEYQSEIIELIKGADGFISLSKHEGMPNVVLESAACGLPMLLSRIPEHTALFKPSEVYYSAYNNIHEVTDMLKRLINDKSKKNYNVIREFSEENIIDSVLSFYKKILSKNDHS